MNIMDLIIITVLIFFVKKYYIGYKSIILLTIVPALMFIILSQYLIKQKLAGFDSMIYKYLAMYISSKATFFMRFISDCGSALSMISISVIIILALIKNKKYKWYGAIIAINLLSTWLLSEAIKLMFQRPRPEILRLAAAGGFSFPSGHSMTSISFYGLLAYLCYMGIKNKLGKYIAAVFLSFLVILIGISRVYLGVHYASDVLAGFSAGLVWLMVFIEGLNRYYFYNLKENHLWI